MLTLRGEEVMQFLWVICSFISTAPDTRTWQYNAVGVTGIDVCMSCNILQRKLSPNPSSLTVTLSQNFPKFLLLSYLLQPSVSSHCIQLFFVSLSLCLLLQWLQSRWWWWAASSEECIVFTNICIQSSELSKWWLILYIVLCNKFGLHLILTFQQ